MSAADTQTLASHPIVRNLREEERSLIVQRADCRQYKRGQLLVAQGDTSRTLFFLMEGKVEIIKTHGDHADRFTIASGDRQGVLGELSFLDGKPASATVKATEPTTACTITYAELVQGGLVGEDAVRGLAAELAPVLTTRLRESDESLVANMRERLLFARLFIVVVVLLGVCSVAGSLLMNHLQNSPESQVYVSLGTVVVLLIPSLYFWIRNRMPLDKFGLNLKSWRTQVVTGVLLALPLIAAAAGYKLLYENEAIVWFGNYQQYPFGLMAIYMLLYLPHSALQELVARGVLQNSLERFVAESNAARAVVLTSVLFGIAHMHFGIDVAVAITLVSFYFGFIFAYFQSLLAVSLTHYLAGFAAIAFGII